MSEAIIAERAQRADAYPWASHLQTSVSWPEPRGDVECQAVFERITRKFVIGERLVFAEMLAAARLSEAAAARQNVASLTPDELKR